MPPPDHKHSKKEDYFDTLHLRADLKKRAVRGAGATVLSQFAMLITNVAGIIILARLLTPTDFGLVTMVTTFSLLLMNFGLNGFTEAIIQRENLNHSLVSTLFWVNGGISLALTLVFMAAAPAIAWFYDEPRLKGITIVIALTIIFTGLSTHHLALLKRQMQFYHTSILQSSTWIIGLIMAITFAWLGWGYWALVIGALTRPFVSAAGAWLLCRWRPGLPARGTGVGQMIRFALNTYGNFSLNYFTRNLDNLLVGWRFGSLSLGLYKKAYDVFILPASQLSAPLTSVALSSLSRLSNEPEKYQRNYLSVLSTLSFIGMVLSAVLTLVGKDFILLLLGSQWDKAGEIFTYFSPGIGVMLIYGTHGWLHLSLGRPDRWLLWGVLEFALTAVFFIVGLPFGPKGVAVAFVTSFYVLIGPCLVYAGRPIRLTFSSLFEAIWKYYVSALFAGVLSWFLLYHVEATSVIFSKLNIYFRILTGSVLCTTVYLLFVIVLFQGVKPISQLIFLLREMIPGFDKKKATVEPN